MYSYNEDGTEHYYEFHTKKGMLLVTTDGKKNNGKVTHISMMYNDANGPTYQAVKNYVGKAVTRYGIWQKYCPVILDILKKAKRLINLPQHQKIKT